MSKKKWVINSHMVALFLVYAPLHSMTYGSSLHLIPLIRSFYYIVYIFWFYWQNSWRRDRKQVEREGEWHAAKGPRPGPELRTAEMWCDRRPNERHSLLQDLGLIMWTWYGYHVSTQLNKIYTKRVFSSHLSADGDEQTLGCLQLQIRFAQQQTQHLQQVTVSRGDVHQRHPVYVAGECIQRSYGDSTMSSGLNVKSKESGA